MTSTSPADLLMRTVLAMPIARTLQLAFQRVEPGHVEIELPVAEAFSFRPGQLQATAVFAAADAGPLLTVCAAEVYAVDESDRETLCATLLGTARNIRPA